MSGEQRRYGEKRPKTVSNLFKGLLQFTTECRKTKTRTITVTNHNSLKQRNGPIRTRTANTCTWHQLRETEREKANIGFTSDWLRKGRKFFDQSESEVKQNQSKRKLPSTLTISFRLNVALRLLGRLSRDAQVFALDTLFYVCGSVQ